MFAGLERREREIVMRFRRSGYCHGVQVVALDQRHSIGVVVGDTQILCSLSRPLFITAIYGRNVPAFRLERRHVDGAAEPDSQNTDFLCPVRQFTPPA